MLCERSTRWRVDTYPGVAAASSVGMPVVKSHAATTSTAPEIRRTVAPPLRTRASPPDARCPSRASTKIGTVAPAA